MTLEEFILHWLEHRPLHPKKSIEEHIALFVKGARPSGWSDSQAKRYTDQFSEKTPGRKNHYMWVLESCGKKYCATCNQVRDRNDFHDNASKKDGKQTKCIACYQQDQQDSPERWRAYTAARKAQKLQATPSWADLTAILEFYQKCPEGHHVDHIVPLQGQLVCGLHVLENLQYLLAVDNLKKSNKFGSQA